MRICFCRQKSNCLGIAPFTLREFFEAISKGLELAFFRIDFARILSRHQMEKEVTCFRKTTSEDHTRIKLYMARSLRLIRRVQSALEMMRRKAHVASGPSSLIVRFAGEVT
jgi:hypothetical protein